MSALSTSPQKLEEDVLKILKSKRYEKNVFTVKGIGEFLQSGNPNEYDCSPRYGLQGKINEALQKREDIERIDVVTGITGLNGESLNHETKIETGYRMKK